MTRHWWKVAVPGAALIVFGLAAAGWRQSSRPAPEETVRVHYAGGVAALDTALMLLAREARQNPTLDATGLQHAFRAARNAYKSVEFLAEYYNPALAEALNGPAIPEVEPNDPNRVIIPADGFQVLEELLFPAPDSADRTAIVAEIEVLRANTRRLAALAAVTRTTPGHVFDASRLALARVVVLGLAGYDSPVALNSLAEAHSAVSAVQRAIQAFAGPLRKAHPDAAEDLERRFASALAVLEKERDFEAFDRLGFIVNEMEPLLAAVHRARTSLRIDLPDQPRAWRADAPSLFAAQAFDASFFAPRAAAADVNAQVELGRLLFHEPLLSGNGKRTCGSCHRPDRAFADGARTSVSYDRIGSTTRNTPSLFNAGLQAGVFYDLRAAYLEDQATEVIASRTEMHGDLEHAAGVILSSSEYREHFRRAYDASDSVNGEMHIRSALAAYIRTIVAMDSRFDRHVRGASVLTSPEQRGFNLFMGKARCATCHFAPLFNGTVPPMYNESDLEVIGVPRRRSIRGGIPDGDPGAYAVRRNPLHRKAFKTPTVRNVALTAPYMHNGAYETLEDVVDFYNRGGGAGIGMTVPNQTLPSDELKLSAGEQRDLVAFMKALTDTTFVAGVPARLPSIPGQAEPRRPGGEY